MAHQPDHRPRARVRRGELHQRLPRDAARQQRRHHPQAHEHSPVLPKTSRAEREAGCGQLPRQTTGTFAIGHASETANERAPVGNHHPTVKPLELMRWLCRLVTPPGGLILDPFCGSGSTGCAAALDWFRFIGIEREPAYVKIARARIAHWADQADITGGDAA